MDDERTAGSVGQSAANMDAAGQYDPQPYLAALKKLEGRAWRSLTICRVLIGAALLLLVPWIVLRTLEKADSFGLYFVGLILVFEAVPVVFPNLFMGIHAARLKEQFAHSGLAERLALGELEKHDPIYGHTPWLLRWLLPRNLSGKPGVTLARVAGSLQWYLASPRIHIKPTWLMGLGFLPFLFIIGMNSMVLGRFPGASLGFPVLIMAIIIPGMFFGLVSNNFVFVRMLSTYLHSAWDEHQVESPISIDEVERKAKMQLMLNQVQQDLELALAAIFMPTLMPLMFGLFPLITSTIFSLNGFAILGLVIGVVEAVIFVTVWLPRYGYATYREAIKAQLETSGVALLIAGGELDKAGLIENTPWLFRVVHNVKQMPKGFADNLRLLIWHAALNLDWFLAHPRRLLRPSWITNILLITVGLGSIVYSVMAPFRAITSMTSNPSSQTAFPTISDMFALGNLKWLLFAAIIALAVPGIIHAIKTRIWTEELIRHLRARLAG